MAVFTFWFVYLFTLIFLSRPDNPSMEHLSTPLHKSPTLRDAGLQCYDGRISPGLTELRRHWLWAWPDVTCRRYRPSFSRSLPTAVVVLLLLCSGVEPNPGPSSVKIGCLNIRSAVHKAALLYDVISDNNMDIVALTETWIASDAPNAVKCDLAPLGFSVFHVHRQAGRGGVWPSSTVIVSSYVT
jgi:hypothetical protein